MISAVGAPVSFATVESDVAGALTDLQSQARVVTCRIMKRRSCFCWLMGLFA